VCGIANRPKDTYTDSLKTYINSTGKTPPFIFNGYYVPTNGQESFTVYAQWYLFGRYLAAQSEGSYGGGDGIYKAILDYEDAEGNYGCTRASLTQVLLNNGIIGEWTETPSFEDFVHHFNIALVLQEKDGLYSFKGRSVTDFEYPLNRTALPTALWGGGSAAVSLNQTEPRTQQHFTPNGADPAMRFAGIIQNMPDMVVADQADNTTLAIGSEVKLSSPDKDVKIQYISSTNPDEILDYTKPLVITQNVTLTANTLDTQGNKSQLSQWIFFAEPELVTASAESGHLKEGSPVTLSCNTKDAKILYTTDGSDPYIRVENDKTILNGTVYDAKTPIIL
ncbi:MAG: chitobiase/beta-hexosaminidase C-terminal domain-containing protein, partial [Eubacterium sp.]